MSDLTKPQRLCFEKMEPLKTYCAFTLRERLSTLRALVRKGYVEDITPPGPGGMYSPRTHFLFRISRERKS